MRLRSLAVLFSVAACATGLGATDVHPNTARGVQPYQAFDVSGLDSINLFNGNLTLAIPIGQEYPVNGGLSYQLTLTYNAQLWDSDLISVNRLAVFPSRTWNAGLGWQLTMGRLLLPNTGVNPSEHLLYLAADASRHRFFDRLHEADAEDPGDTESVQLVRYTRDSSYLRLRDSSPPGVAWTVDFPSGARHVFDSQGRLYAVVDPFDNSLLITYSTGPEGNEIWTLFDGHRTNRVYFRSATLDGTATQVVDRIELAAFGGATATYQFAYTSAQIRRACPETDPSTPDTFTAPFLTAVVFPDGSAYNMPIASSYLLEVPEPPDPECKLSGVLRRLTLPTFGSLEWDYRVLALPEESVVEDDGDLRKQLSRSVAVKARRTIDATGLMEGEWQYIHVLTPPPPLDPPAREKRTAVVSPGGDKTVHYFSVWPDGVPAPGGWDFREYGLPFTRFQSDSSSGLWLSSQVFDCDANPADPTNPQNCESFSRTFVGYERDVDSSPQAAMEDGFFFNQRALVSRTFHDDDTGRFVEVRFGEFDGYGHYREVSRIANFDAGNDHRSRTNFNPGTGIYPGSFVQRPFGDEWLLELFDAKEVTEPGAFSRSEFTFEVPTGTLQCERRLRAGASRGAHDVLVKYGYSAEGNRTSAAFLGGDEESLLLTQGCTADGSLVPKYEREYEYSFGAQRSEKYSGVEFFSMDLDIDSSTGLPAVYRDSAGQATEYTYDTRGRPLTIVPQGTERDAWTAYVYYPTAFPVGFDVSRCNPGASTCTGTNRLTSETVEFDALGRVHLEKRRLPGAAEPWSRRVTLYDSEGRTRRRSEWLADSLVQPPTDEEALPATVYSDYDPMGRARTLTPADGANHAVSRQFVGVRVVNTTRQVALGLDLTETAVARTEYFDGQGRLFEVQEQPDPTTTAYVATRYEYDEGGRLVRVCQDRSEAPPGAEVCGQERTWVYDNRGFLESERHPEKGADGNGTVTYGAYDALGHPGQLEDGAATRRLFFDFDSAERLTRVEFDDGLPAPYPLLKEFAYDAAPGAGGGKLATATAVNRFEQFGAEVGIQESYAYLGRQGRVSNRTTKVTINGGPAEGWAQGFTWAPLGRPASVTYPVCTGGGCGSISPTPQRTIDYGYDDGLLKSAGGYASSLTYHPNLLLASVVHTNGVTDWIATDPSGLARPHRFYTTGASINGDTGDYLFDGSGNVKGIGTERYRFDRVDRLREGHYGPDSDWAQSVAYDRFGNITSITTTTEPGSPETVATETNLATNRLCGPSPGPGCSAPGTSLYDAAGNLTSRNLASYQFDLLNRMVGMNTGSEGWVYAYTADDERIWAVRSDQGRSIWTLRDLDGQVLRRAVFTGSGAFFRSPQTAPDSATAVIFQDDFELGDLSRWTAAVPNGPVWFVYDYVWRGNQLLAVTDVDNDVHHFHLDHLGTPRLITDEVGDLAAYHAYHPFGQEATAPNQDQEVMKFAGQQRELHTTWSQPEDDLDYLHARFSSPITGRFLSPDPSPKSIRLNLPQSWNRYSYTLGNPLRFVDPTGAVLRAANSVSQRAYDSYVSSLDPESEDYQNLAQLENSEIVYVVNVEDLGGGNEGSVTFDGESVFLNVDPAGARDTMSFNSRLSHEVEHGVQVDSGMIGFRRQSSGDWRVTFTDIFDEVDAWMAQLRQAAPADLFRGNLRGFQQAEDRAGFLMNHGYEQYRGRTGATQRVNAPGVPGYTPGSVLRTDNWFYRIPR